MKKTLNTKLQFSILKWLSGLSVALILTFSFSNAYSVPPSLSPLPCVDPQIRLIEVEECEKMRKAGVFNADVFPFECTRLRKIVFPHIDFNGNTQIGEVVVLDIVASRVKNIFYQLYMQSFPIHKAVPMEHYHGDDGQSMEDNNTSGFNSRFIARTNLLSTHAYGLALDINPVQNPYVLIGKEGEIKVFPRGSEKVFLNRSPFQPETLLPREGMVESVLDIFLENGFFTWGGNWDYTRIDYQHFQAGEGEFVEQLAALPFEAASALFEARIRNYNQCMHTKVQAGIPKEKFYADCVTESQAYLAQACQLHRED